MTFIKKYKNILSGLLINTVEYYSVVLYGYYTSVMAPVFFPSDNPKLNEKMGLAVFALSFILQPWGAFLMGKMGDRYGRKMTLVLGVLLVALPTLLVGLLPGYEMLGILAPFILLIALIIQSVGSVGGYNGTAVFLNEFSESRTKAFLSGLLIASSFFGALVASLFGTFGTALGGWRSAFLMGGILGIATLGLRKHLEETPVFKKSLKEKGIESSSFLEILHTRKRNLVCALGIAAGYNLPFYLISVYFNSFLVSDLHISHSATLLYNTIVLCFWAVLLPLMGHVGDKIGTKRLMLISSVGLALLSVPLFMWGMADPTLLNLTLLRIILSLLGIGILAPASAYLITLFPVQERQRGVGTCAALGTTLFGGTAPFICSLLVEATGQPIAPGYYLAFCSLACAISIMASKPFSDSK